MFKLSLFEGEQKHTACVCLFKC